MFFFWTKPWAVSVIDKINNYDLFSLISENKKKARALFYYSAIKESELTIKSGDVIDDVQPAELDGWLFGTLDGKSGDFPSFIVEVIKPVGKSSLC